jgi:hypothetical protein
MAPRNYLRIRHITTTTERRVMVKGMRKMCTSSYGSVPHYNANEVRTVRLGHLASTAHIAGTLRQATDSLIGLYVADLCSSDKMIDTSGMHRDMMDHILDNKAVAKKRYAGQTGATDGHGTAAWNTIMIRKMLPDEPPNKRPPLPNGTPEPTRRSSEAERRKARSEEQLCRERHRNIVLGALATIRSQIRCWRRNQKQSCRPTSMPAGTPNGGGRRQQTHGLGKSGIAHTV